MKEGGRTGTCFPKNQHQQVPAGSQTTSFPSDLEAFVRPARKPLLILGYFWTNFSSVLE